MTGRRTLRAALLPRCCPHPTKGGGKDAEPSPLSLKVTATRGRNYFAELHEPTFLESFLGFASCHPSW